MDNKYDTTDKKNLSTRKETRAKATSPATNPTWTVLGLNPCRGGETSATTHYMSTNK